MNDKEPVKNLGMISKLFILLGALDIFILIGDIMFGEVSIDSISSTVPEWSEAVTIMMYVAIAYIVIAAFVNIYLGVCGLKQTKGTLNGKMHITIAKIVRVLYIIGFVFEVINCISSKKFDIVELSKSAVAVLFVFYYIKYAAEIANGKN